MSANSPHEKSANPFMKMEVPGPELSIPNMSALAVKVLAHAFWAVEC